MSRERPPWSFAIVGILGASLLWLLRMSWRIREEPRRVIPKRRASRAGPPGTIYVNWHSRLLLAVATQGRHGVHVLVSQHADGEYIARSLERLGSVTIRGSSSRGGARALLAIVRTLEEGNDVAITPDGPKGPRLRVQAGCIIAAMRARATIVPIGYECRPATRLSSWDRFILPWPFARVAVLAGDPIEVPPRLDEAGVAAWCARLEAALNDVTRRAAAVVGLPAELPDVDPRATS